MACRNTFPAANGRESGYEGKDGTSRRLELRLLHGEEGVAGWIAMLQIGSRYRREKSRGPVLGSPAPSSMPAFRTAPRRGGFPASGRCCFLDVSCNTQNFGLVSALPWQIEVRTA